MMIDFTDLFREPKEKKDFQGDFISYQIAFFFQILPCPGKGKCSSWRAFKVHPVSVSQSATPQRQHARHYETRFANLLFQNKPRVSSSTNIPSPVRPHLVLHGPLVMTAHQSRSREADGCFCERVDGPVSFGSAGKAGGHIQEAIVSTCR
jgi:hypothetical protein